jgi:beta-lactam-binding protein with PASTA domain
LTLVATTLTAALLLVAALVGCGSSHKSYVVVPLRAQQTDLVDAYNLLHGRGLRVEVATTFAISSLRSMGVARLSPGAGSRLARGSTVSISTGPGPIGSPAVLKSHPHYRVPNFIGRSARTAVAWADAHNMFWAIPRVPALPSSDAPRLFDAYRVVSQLPEPGGRIVQGVMVGRGFKPTPLTLTVVLK